MKVLRVIMKADCPIPDAAGRNHFVIPKPNTSEHKGYAVTVLEKDGAPHTIRIVGPATTGSNSYYPHGFTVSVPYQNAIAVLHDLTPEKK